MLVQLGNKNRQEKKNRQVRFDCRQLKEQNLEYCFGKTENYNHEC